MRKRRAWAVYAILVFLVSMFVPGVSSYAQEPASTMPPQRLYVAAMDVKSDQLQRLQQRLSDSLYQTFHRYSDYQVISSSDCRDFLSKSGMSLEQVREKRDAIKAAEACGADAFAIGRIENNKDEPILQVELYSYPGKKRLGQASVSLAGSSIGQILTIRLDEAVRQVLGHTETTDSTKH